MTTEQQQEITRLYNSGIRVKSIGTITGIDDNLVKRYIYRVMKLPRRNMKHNMGNLQRMKELRLQGKSGKEIQAIIGMNRDQMRYLLDLSGEGFRKWDKERSRG